MLVEQTVLRLFKRCFLGRKRGTGELSIRPLVEGPEGTTHLNSRIAVQPGSNLTISRLVSPTHQDKTNVSPPRTFSDNLRMYLRAL